MADSVHQAAVFAFSQRVGTLSKTAQGFTFVYDPNYLRFPEARPISFSLPLQTKSYESPHLFSFFDGLLPEGWLLDLTARAAQIDKNDKFGLLLHTGKDPVGAISVRPINTDDN
jgi:serine/threonine-protein kinase HipA